MNIRSLHRTLIKNYIVFVLIIILVVILTIAFLAFSVSSIITEEIFPKISANSIARIDYENIDISDIRLMDGWVEILDNDNKVIYVLGNKKTAVEKYSNNQLYQMLSYDGSGQQYTSTAKAFEAANGESYTCLVILPVDKVDLQLNIVNAPLPISRRFITIILIALLFFLILFILNVFLYSKWTAKKIGLPLERITTGIKDMSTGKLDTRMDFKAENEFLQIRDAFNNMAEKLEMSQTEKKKLEEARKRMFVDISHDLKTPMTVIGGYSKALAEGMVMDEQQKQRYLNTIYSKSVRVSNLIENLFDLAKYENGNILLNKENTDVVEFLRGIAAEHYEQIEEKGLLLDLKIPEEPVPCIMDKKEMSRVITNILNNAIQYNSAGTMIKIELSRNEKEIIIEIADDGRGISKNLSKVIFDPFTRGDMARSSDGGTGLGLAIAKKIVENHDGSLKLNTDKGSYKTVFVITLPCEGAMPSGF